jgi:hypothetical protein
MTRIKKIRTISAAAHFFFWACLVACLPDGRQPLVFTLERVYLRATRKRTKKSTDPLESQLNGPSDGTGGRPWSFFYCVHLVFFFVCFFFVVFFSVFNFVFVVFKIVSFEI